MINYFGADEQGTVETYLNGIVRARDNTISQGTYTQGNGRIAIGRFWVEEDHSYSSMEIDELLFLNVTLTSDQIESLANI